MVMTGQILIVHRVLATIFTPVVVPNQSEGKAPYTYLNLPQTHIASVFRKPQNDSPTVSLFPFIYILVTWFVATARV
jgi:hypothetical protein